VPGYVAVDGGAVMLDTNVDRVLEVMRIHGGMLSPEVLRATYLEPLIMATSPLA
jgi:hypothetical protein